MSCGTAKNPSGGTSVQNSKDILLNEAPPTQLDTIKSESKNIADDISRSDWTKAKIKLNNIKSNINELKNMLQNKNVQSSVINGLTTSLEGLKVSIENKRSEVAKREANSITRYLPDILDKYKTELPTDIDRLEYFGREIKLNIDADDWQTATINVNKLKQTGKTLTSKLNQNYKSDIEKFQNIVDKLINNINSKNKSSSKAELGNLFESIENLRKDFEISNK